MPYAVKGLTSDGGELWLSSNGNWVPDERHAGEFLWFEASNHVNSINSRNRSADLEDRIEPTIIGPDK
jgi:hypothetical protein